MLNGVNPIMIVTFFQPKILSFFSDIPLLGRIIEDIGGFPVPLPFREGATKMAIDEESRSINIATSVESSSETDEEGEIKTVQVTQRVAEASVNIRFQANTKSDFFVLLIALMERIIPLVANGNYKISWLNGPTVIFGAKLASFNTALVPGTTLMNIDLTLSTAEKEPPTKKSGTESLNRVQNAVKAG